MEQSLIEYKNNGFLESRTVDEKELLHLTAPCRLKLDKAIVADLKANYKSDEEIGGVLWVKPTRSNEEIIHLIDKVTYIRNAIEDIQRSDFRNKSNAYLPDSKELHNTLTTIFSQGYLPIKFHTHPIKGTSSLHSITYPNLQTETSEQDKKESYLTHTIGSKNLLMPRALIVGSDLSNDIFIGVYNGFIAPSEFENSKKEIQQENLKKTGELVSSIHLSDGQKLGLALGAVLLFFVIIKYRKTSLPVLFGLGAMLPLLLTNTKNIDKPSYFNRLAFGDAEIYIPYSNNENI